jgi:hypothetical protein
VEARNPRPDFSGIAVPRSDASCNAGVPAPPLGPWAAFNWLGHVEEYTAGSLVMRRDSGGTGTTLAVRSFAKSDTALNRFRREVDQIREARE